MLYRVELKRRLDTNQPIFLIYADIEAMCLFVKYRKYIEALAKVTFDEDQVKYIESLEKWLEEKNEATATTHNN